jgi:hypothetical protein
MHQARCRGFTVPMKRLIELDVDRWKGQPPGGFLAVFCSSQDAGAPRVLRLSAIGIPHSLCPRMKMSSNMAPQLPQFREQPPANYLKVVMAICLAEETVKAW